jgi:subtilisin family serine protease
MPQPTRLPFGDLTGHGVRVAMIDSGVNPAHPHVAGVAGGVSINADGENSIYLDTLGHGTAVAGVIREKAPDALLYAVKVFDQSLRTNVETIIRAIEWAIEHEMNVINLSLGTLNQSHRERFEQIVARVAQSNIVLVAAREMSGQEAYPGCLNSVIGVGLDWDCPRDSFRCAVTDSRLTFFASGYPRAVPGVPPERNLHGISFAVANMTGFVVRAKQMLPKASVRDLEEVLMLSV